MSFNWAPFGPSRDDDPAAPAAGLPRRPARGLAVLTCMDCRIDPLTALGLALGDAVVLRNAGAQASEDVLRSLRVARDVLGVTTVHVVAHTDCAAHEGDDESAEADAHRVAARIHEALPGLTTQASIIDVR